MTKSIAPWDTENGAKFLSSFEPYLNMLKTVKATLELEARPNPHEIRAAAALVILLCRENLWPTREGIDELDRIVSLAVQQMTSVKQMLEQRGRIQPKVLANPNYRSLLNSINEEIRILESRISDPKPVNPRQPPSSWGDFWY